MVRADVCFWPLNDGTHFSGWLSLSGSTGHAPLKHADRFGAIDPNCDIAASCWRDLDPPVHSGKLARSTAR